MGRLEEGMVRSLKTGSVCTAQACALIPMKKRTLVSTLFLFMVCGRGLLKLGRANYVQYSFSRDYEKSSNGIFYKQSLIFCLVYRKYKSVALCK